MSRDVLAMIDGAVEDWTTGSDAMRWTPDTPASKSPRRALQFAPPPITAPIPRPPRVTSVEITVRTSDGRAMTYEFEGEHNNIDVEMEQQTDRDRDDWSFDPRRPITHSWRTEVSLKVTARPLGSSGPVYTVRTSPPICEETR